MNDISVKIVESPKEVVAVGSPAAETRQNEVDPLAIEETAEEEPVPVEPAASNDNDAKKERAEENKNEDVDSVVTEAEKAKEELLKEDTSSINSQEEEVIEPLVEPETPENLDIDESNNDTPTEAAPEPEPILPPVQVMDTATPDLPDDPVEDAIPAQEPEPVPEEKSIPEKLKEDKDEKEPSPLKEVKEAPIELPSRPETEPKSVEKIDVVMKEVIAPVVLEKIEKVAKVTTPPVEEKMEKKKEPKTSVQTVNGDISKEEQTSKRRASEEIETESPLKRLCQEVEKTFPQHDTMINDYIQTATKNNIDEIQRHTEQLLAEIQTLRELAQKKEHEWNNILHLKKVKEEILLRLLRRKQVLSFEKSAEVNGSDSRTDPFDYLNQAKNLAIDKSDEISGLAIKQPGSTMNPMIQAPVMAVTSHFNPLTGLPPPYDKGPHMQPMPKPVFPQPLMMPGPMQGFPRDMNGQLPTSYGLPMGRQGPTKDVKSIIADYRQRNPDITPRRGRRMKSILNPMMNIPRPIAPKVDPMNNLNNLNMLFNNLDMNQKAMLERLQQIQAGGLPNSIFKDALVQFANMQQASSGLIPNRPAETMNRPEHHVKERRRPVNKPERPSDEPPAHKPSERVSAGSPRLPPPPPYPEISLLPVSAAPDTQATQNSLLHGILTKQAPPQSFSPTLAKLLTSPERKQSAPAPQVLPSFGQAKNCGEITITPVQPTPPPEPQPEKTEEVVQLDDEESPASEGEASTSPAGSGSGRLVIDEGGAEAGDAPLCQGCRRRDAQFVCAGCANQWYCSRECQVAAWDEHSEMCSG